MKITLEPTNKGELTNPYVGKVSIEVAGDDHNLEFLFEWMIKPALAAMGFDEKSISAYLDECEEASDGS